MSRIGTKLTALLFNPELYLEKDAVITQQQIATAEEYLVKVWSGANSKTSCKTYLRI